jgi:hypothetical protein
LYTKRRVEPSNPGIFSRDLERKLVRPREHLEFTIWFLEQKRYITTDDNSRLSLTAEGAEHLEESYGSIVKGKRLPASRETSL